MEVGSISVAELVDGWELCGGVENGADCDGNGDGVGAVLLGEEESADNDREIVSNRREGEVGVLLS